MPSATCCACFSVGLKPPPFLCIPACVCAAEVMSFEDEKQLLLRWRDLVLETDPDVIIG